MSAFEFPQDVKNEYVNNLFDSKGAEKRLEKYQAEISKQIEELESQGIKIDRNQFVLDYVNTHIPSGAAKKIHESLRKYYQEEDEKNDDLIKKYEGYYYKPNGKYVRVWHDSKRGMFKVSGKKGQDFTPEELNDLLKDYPEKKSTKDKPKDPMAVFIAGAQNFVKLRLDQIKELKGKDLEEAKLETFTFSDSEEYVQIKNENDPAKKKKMLAVILKGDEEIKKAFEERKKQLGQKPDSDEHLFQSIEEDFHGKLLKLEKLATKKGKKSNVEVGEKLEGVLQSKKIEVGKYIVLSGGDLGPVEEIKKEADGSYLIKTETSAYRLSVMEADVVPNEPQEPEEEQKSEEEKKLEEDLKDLEEQLKYANREGNEEVIGEIQQQIVDKKEEIENLKKSGIEIFEEAQVMEAEAKAGTKEEEKNLKPKDIIGEDQDRKITEAGKRLEEMRKEYIRKNDEMEKHSSVFRRLFGIGKRNKGQIDEEFEKIKGDYETALKTYKDESMKNVTNEQEVGKVIDKFTKGEHVSLALEKKNLQAEKEKEHLSSKLVGIFNRAAEIYHNLSTKKKILAGIAIAGIAVGGGYIAGAAGIGATSAGIFARFASGAVATAGYKGRFDAKAEQKRDEKIEKEKSEMLNNSKVEGMGAIDFDLVSKNLDQKIMTIDSEIQNINQSAKGRNLKALIAGTGTSLLFGYIGKHYFGPAIEKVVDHFKNWHSHGSNFIPQGGGHESLQNLNTGNVTIDHKLPVSDLLVHKGSSLEGTLIEHFKSAGMSAHEAGVRAHEMAIEYANTHPVDGSLIHGGAHIHLGLNDTKIESITGDSHLGTLHHAVSHAQVHRPAGSGGTYWNNLKHNPNAPHPEGNYTMKDSIAPADSLHHTAPPVENFNVHNTVFEKRMDGFLQDLHSQASQINETIQYSKGVNTYTVEQMKIFKDRLADLQFSGRFLAKFNNAILAGRKGAASKELLNAVTRAIKENDNDRLASVITLVKGLLGDQAKRNIGEGLKPWSERVARLAVQAITKK